MKKLISILLLSLVLCSNHAEETKSAENTKDTDFIKLIEKHIKIEHKKIR